MDTRRVLVPTDFSDLAALAYPVALAEALAQSAQIEFVHVYRPPAVTFSADTGAASPQAVAQLFESARNQASLTLNCLAQKHFKGVPVQCSILDHIGHEGDAIVEFGRKYNVDMIVLSTHGGGLVRQLLLGSVAERVLRRSTCAVLTVPARNAPSFRDSRHLFKRILVTTDFSPEAERAYGFAERQAQLFGSKLCVLHVVDPASDYGTAHEIETSILGERDDRGHETSSLARKLDAIARSLGGAEAIHELAPLDRSVHRSILEAAKRFDADLIVMASKGSNRSFSLGGVAEKVLRGAHCPVLTVQRHDDDDSWCA